jgi:hypothetical protein
MLAKLARCSSARRKSCITILRTRQRFTGSEEQQLTAFRRVRDQLRGYLHDFIRSN